MTVGERCMVELTKIQGTCKKHIDCPLVQEQARKGIPPTTCGYYEFTEPIVCCEADAFVEPNDGTLLNLSNKPNIDFVFPSNDPDEPPAYGSRLTKSEQSMVFSTKY